MPIKVDDKLQNMVEEEYNEIFNNLVFHANAMSAENVRGSFDELISEVLLDQKLKERSDLIIDEIWD